MNSAIMQAKYPIVGTKCFIKVVIGRPEIDPKSKHGDRRCKCTVSAHSNRKNFYIYGVDEIQCVWIALKQIKVVVSELEKKMKIKGEYYYW